MKITKDKAITMHLKHWDKFPIFYWQEGDDLVTQVDGIVFKAKTMSQLSRDLDAVAPTPRSFYFVDSPDYQD